MLKALLRVKPVEPAGHVDAGEPIEGSLDGEATLKRTLTAKHLILLGVGAVIGAGIFVLTGQAAANHAGPAVMLSFVIAGFACALAGLCYAEFAAMMPVSGSAYSYSYATLGEGMAWFIGWCLVLEYLFASASVAVGWSAYLISFITTTLHMPFPDALSAAPIAWTGSEFIASGKLFNLPAVLIVAAVSGLLYVGVTQSAFVNAIIVAIKVTVICLFIGIGAAHIDPANWQPFIPENTGVPGEFGWSGVFRAATIVFFAYIGFDAVSTAAGETKDPQRNMPIGLLGSLAVCTLVYIIVCAVLTGMMPYHLLGTDKPVATALMKMPIGLPTSSPTKISQVGAAIALKATPAFNRPNMPRMISTGFFHQCSKRSSVLFRSISRQLNRPRSTCACGIVGMIGSSPSAGCRPALKKPNQEIAPGIRMYHQKLCSFSFLWNSKPIPTAATGSSIQSGNTGPCG